MDSEIFFNIIDSQKGRYYPNCSRDIKNYESFSYLFDEKPATLEQTEKLLQAITKDIIVFDFEKYHPEVNSDTKAVYTTVPNDYFPVNIPIEPPVSTTHERFYSALISWECLHIKFLLRQYVNAVKDDSKSRKEITNTLQNIAHYAAEASETVRLQMHQDLIMLEGYPEYDIVVESTSHIYKFLIQSLTKLYFEITIIFDCILKRADYLSIPDFYNQKLCYYNTDKKLKPFYEASVHIHKAQNICEPEEIKALLKELYSDLKKVSLSSIPSVITMLENKLFLIDSDTLYTPQQLSDSSVMMSVYYQKRKDMTEIISALSSTIETLSVIDEEKENLSFYIENNAKTNSVPRKLIVWLNKQEELYKNCPSQIPSISVPKTPLSKSKNSNKEILSFTYTTQRYTSENEKNENIKSLFKNLKQYQAIPQELPITEFKHLLSGKKVMTPIPWIGQKSDLTYLFKLLVNDMKILETGKNTIWSIIATCFVDKDGKHFDAKQLRKQQKPRISATKIEDLASILE